MYKAQFVYPVNVMCVYRASGHTTSASVLHALHTAAAGGCVQAKSPTETTTHIKGVPLVEYDYKLLSHESTSPPREEKRRSGFSLNMSRPQSEFTSHPCFLKIVLFFFLNYL